MTTKFPSDKQDKFMLRLPDGMRDKIAQKAEANGRSMNAEIISRLAESFDLVDWVEAEKRHLKPMLERLERVLTALETEPENGDMRRRLRVAMTEPPQKKKPARGGP